MNKSNQGFFVNLYGQPVPITEVVKELSALEDSWADFLAGMQPTSLGRKVYCNSNEGKVISAIGLKGVHNVLKEFQDKYKKGERSAAWNALVFCSAQNVPMPYWLAEAVQKINSKVLFDRSEVVTLHSEFGMEAIAPAKGSRSESRRRDNSMKKLLYAAVVDAMQKRRSTDLDPALSDVLAEGKFSFEKTKARTLFKEQEKIQATHLKMQDK